MSCLHSSFINIPHPVYPTFTPGRVHPVRLLVLGDHVARIVLVFLVYSSVPHTVQTAATAVCISINEDGLIHSISSPFVRIEESAPHLEDATANIKESLSQILTWLQDYFQPLGNYDAFVTLPAAGPWERGWLR